MAIPFNYTSVSLAAKRAVEENKSFEDVKKTIQDGTPKNDEVVEPAEEVDVAPPVEESKNPEPNDDSAESNMISDDSSDEEIADNTEEMDHDSSDAESDITIEQSSPEQQETGHVENNPVFNTGDNDTDLNDFKKGFDEVYGEVMDVDPVAIEMPKNVVKESPKQNILSGNTKIQSDKKQTSNTSEKKSTGNTSKKNKSDDDGVMSHLRNIPQQLVQRTRYLFPAARNNDESVSAYIYFKEGCPVDLDVSDRIKEVAASYIGGVVTNEDVQDNLIKEISRIKSNDRLLMQKIDAIEMGIVYSLFDRLGFRKGDTRSLNDINFAEKGMRELLENLETTSVNYQNHIRTSEGRTKR